MDAPQPLRLRFDRFDVDEANAQLLRAGEPLAIPPKAFDVLCALLRTPGMLVTKDQLLDAVWGHRHVSESVLKTTISELRGVLDDDAKSPRYIETAARRGYRFVGMAASVAAPVPAAPAAVIEGCIGRAAERAQLAQWWANAATGEWQLCWVAGEAGIGKTTVVDAFVSGLAKDAAVARGQCVEQFGAGEPYLPVLDALAALCRTDATVLAHLRETAPTWLLQMPWLLQSGEREALRDSLGGVTQDRMLREFAEFTGRFTALRPWLLVTEDLHWADGATLRLIDHMARRRAPARFMWLASFRIAELVAANHPLNSLRHEWRTRRLGNEMLLEPFSEEELGEYLGRRSFTAASEALVRDIHRQTDGLPLFVANVVDDLLSRGTTDAGRAGNWTVPETLAGLVEAQLARLEAEDVRLLQAASVCGVQFSVGLLAGVLEQPADEVAQACDRLARHQHWIGPATVAALADGSLDAQHTFRHALYRHVIHQRLGAMERARLHRLAAQALSRKRDAGGAVSAAELAAHCEAGLDAPGALRAYVAAAEHALSRFAPVEALALCDRAKALLRQCPDGPEKIELELSLSHFEGAGHAQTTGVTSKPAQAAFRRASVLSEMRAPARQRALAMAGLSLMHGSSGNYDEGHAVAVELRQIALAEGDEMLLAVACVGMAFPLMQKGELARAWELLEQSIAATRDPGRVRDVSIVLDPPATLRALGAMVLMELGRRDEALALLAEALARAQAIGQPISHGLVLRCHAAVHARLGRPDLVHGYATQMAVIVSTHGLSVGGAPSECLLGWSEAKLRDARAGHARIAQGCERMIGSGSRYDITFMLYLAADAAMEARDDAQAAVHLERGFELANKTGERLNIPRLLLARSRIETRRGDAAAARASLESALQAARAIGSVWMEREVLSARDA